MMVRTRPRIAFLLCFGLVGLLSTLAAEADSPCADSSSAGKCCAGLMLCCPDNYCAKPLPCLTPPGPCRCRDNYCAKPLPCLRGPGPCCCNDTYCRKPLPCLCWPRLPVNYSCGATHFRKTPLDQNGNGKK